MTRKYIFNSFCCIFLIGTSEKAKDTGIKYFIAKKLRQVVNKKIEGMLDLVASSTKEMYIKNIENSFFYYLHGSWITKLTRVKVG